MQYAIARNGQHLGSFPEEETRRGLTQGYFTSHDLAWAEGMSEWCPLGQLFPDAPPPLPTSLSPKQSIESNIGMRMLLPVGRSGWAIAAGYMGLTCLALFPAPIAILVSIIAILDLQRSKKQGKKKYGMGRAIFGLIAGILGTIMLFRVAFSMVNFL